MSVAAYPLQWPEGWAHHEGPKDKSSFKTPTEKAYRNVIAEVGRMSGNSVVVSSNAPLRADGKMRLDREPVDSGIAVYFQRKGTPVAFACDRFDTLRDNLQAIAKTIEALRGLERWGASDMMERAFTGFKALGAGESKKRNWWEVLEVDKNTTSPAEIETQFRKLAKSRHPDFGGSAEQFTELQEARQSALDACFRVKL